MSFFSLSMGGENMGKSCPIPALLTRIEGGVSGNCSLIWREAEWTDSGEVTSHRQYRATSTTRHDSRPGPHIESVNTEV
jgi:hypothetical protein